VDVDMDEDEGESVVAEVMASPFGDGAEEVRRRG